nr:hypothetical protein [Tanacetum cinerariifolium]
MLATEASLKTELEASKEKHDPANKDRSLMVTDLLPYVVKTLLSSKSFSTLLADLQRKAILVSRAQASEEVVDIGLGLELGSGSGDWLELWKEARDWLGTLKPTYILLASPRGVLSLADLSCHALAFQ